MAISWIHGHAIELVAPFVGACGLRTRQQNICGGAAFYRRHSQFAGLVEQSGADK